VNDPDVTIPRGTAKMWASAIRSECRIDYAELADLLDPQAPSLRDEVARAWCAEVYGEDSGSALNPAPDQLDAADAVLTVVADWLAAQLLAAEAPYSTTAWRLQRDHDVRLLRGES